MDLFSDATHRDPYPLYAQLRASTPVVHVQPQDVWLVLGFDAVKRTLHDATTFSSNVSPARGEAFEWLLFMDPPRHAKLRALVSHAFTSRSIAALEPRIRRLSSALVAALPDDELDLATAYATPLPLMVIAEMLGLPPTDWRTYARWSEAIVNLGNTISGTGAADAEAAFAIADREMGARFGAELHARRRAPRDDLMTRLAQAEVDGERLADHELVRFCQLLLAAGAETTTNLIDNAMIAFTEHPDELARVRRDPALMPAAIEEVLRYRAPVQAMFRATRADVDLDGTRIPAGRFVIACIGAANRDPRRFLAPDRFDVTREPTAHLAFGHGIHFCLGAPLARLEARIALADLLQRFAAFELVDRAWPPRGSFHVHGPRSLRLRVRASP